MLNEEDLRIIAFARFQIVTDAELLDDVPPGPWKIDEAAHAIISAETGKVTPVGNTHAIVSYAPNAGPGTIADVYDNRRQPVTPEYIVRVADPEAARIRHRAMLGQLETCHRALAVEGPEQFAHILARRLLRFVAANWSARDGYHPSWSPDFVPLELPVTANGSGTS